MRASKADKFYMGMLLAIICFCFGLLRIMDEADARRAAERETLIIVEPADHYGPGLPVGPDGLLRAGPGAGGTGGGGVHVQRGRAHECGTAEVLWDACQEHKVEYALALGLIETESSFNPEAVSYVGCYGLMQLNPDYFPADLSPAENIQYGVAFIAEKLEPVRRERRRGPDGLQCRARHGNREYAEKVMAAAERWRTE